MAVLVAVSQHRMLDMTSSEEQVQEGVSTSNSDLLIKIRPKRVGGSRTPDGSPGSARG